ncbi:SEC-C metal-binding domain-containing protein [Allopontixanthobacter sediminis]|uniref:SEC-C motif-containing protein n=1 Tax=Allopontixanthobacter sediminis TaxID=1689985 RepID=A0A845B6B6_9SPHN|nr:SEC-C metal-binding domain-containing protein [Allopontixanthobacter sediminis]MXP44977.1 hypothetical protein [Allopontixanthobacter sediminis]
MSADADITPAQATSQRRDSRPEQLVFDELGRLVAAPGFAHVIAALCARDNFTWYRDEMRAEDMAHLYSRSRLIRTEMFTMIGLMMRSDPDLSAPTPADPGKLAKRAEELLSELHDSMNQPRVESMREAMLSGDMPNPWTQGDAMREPIFYGGEGAFSFQNCDFASQKYSADDSWIITAKGASIDEMIAVARAIGRIQTDKLTFAIHAGLHQIGDPRFLDSFTFDADEIVASIGLPHDRVLACIHAFALPNSHGNPTFRALTEFNAVNAMPILARGDDRFVLFHWNALAEALYEAPFYWLGADKSYAPTAFKHRGDFTETFALKRLCKVFGESRVFHGVNIERGKGDRVGEIDVLVLFGDRAIVLQAKSKRLTLEARRGNDLQIKGDFKAAIQDSYDQAMDCAEALRNPNLRFLTSDGATVRIPAKLTQIFLICVVADHYPALAFQADQFLVQRNVVDVKSPLVIDIFTLDAMAEMLDRPLRFLSYLELRATYGVKVHIHHEITLLSYHLKYNLWLDDEYDMVALEDDFAADLEIAMGARRLGLPGKRTPEGILTVCSGRHLETLIAALEGEPFGPMIDLVLLIYQLSGSALKELADGIDRVLDLARQNSSSDFSIGFADTGITIHSNFMRRLEAEPRLEAHMALRKYKQKVDSWYGISLSPTDGTIRFGKKVAFPWAFDPELQSAARQLGKAKDQRSLKRNGVKLGRNDPCHCGSGEKYKKCHLNADASK